MLALVNGASVTPSWCHEETELHPGAGGGVALVNF
jgi:hypothetical protein